MQCAHFYTTARHLHEPWCAAFTRHTLWGGPRKKWPEILPRSATSSAPARRPMRTRAASSALSECSCTVRLPAGRYLMTPSRVQGADASTTSRRAQRSTHHRRAPRVVATTTSTGQRWSVCIRAAPLARRLGSRATPGRATRVPVTMWRQERCVCTDCRELVARHDVQVPISTGSDTL